MRVSDNKPRCYKHQTGGGQIKTKRVNGEKCCFGTFVKLLLTLLFQMLLDCISDKREGESLYSQPNAAFPKNQI